MSDPLDGILPPIAAAPPAVDPPADPPAAPSAEELLRQQNERLMQMVEAQGGQINDLRTQVAAAVAPPPPDPGDPNAQYWQDPVGSAQRIADQRIQATVAPQAKALNEKLGRIAIQTYLGNKAGDSFYPHVAPLFQKRIASVPVEAIGAADDAAVQSMLDVAWDAALGQYVQDQRKARPVPPPNLGGGSGGGSGPNGKKTLLELDARAYNMAVKNGFSEEQMQQMADEIVAEMEG